MTVSGCISLRLDKKCTDVPFKRIVWTKYMQGYRKNALKREYMQEYMKKYRYNRNGSIIGQNNMTATLRCSMISNINENRGSDVPGGSGLSATTNIGVGNELLYNINTEQSFNSALQKINRTKVKEGYLLQTDTPSSIDDDHHYPCICVICDCFIYGTEELHWISKGKIMTHKHRLSVMQYPYEISDALVEQYEVNDPDFKHILLSPRATMRLIQGKDRMENTYTCCGKCFRSLRNDRMRKYPPRFAIANGWAIGHLPNDIYKNVNEVVSMMIALTRPHIYVIGFSGGQHKTIKGNCTFFNQNVTDMGAAFHHTTSICRTPSVYVVLCGRFTPDQRIIIKNRCYVNHEQYISLISWLKDNNHHYSSLSDIEHAPQPVIIEDKPDVNNTDYPGDVTMEQMLSFQYFFPSVGDPEEASGTYSSSDAFATALIKGETPTMLFHPNELVVDRDLDLTKIFPVQFPFGVGSPLCTRMNKISHEECLKHYLQLSLPQFHHPDFVLVVSHMITRIHSFRYASLRCRANTGDEHLAERISKLSESNLLSFINHNECVDESSDDIMHSYIKTISASCKCVGHSNEAAQLARHKLMNMWVTFGPPSIFFTISPCDECTIKVKLLATLTPQKLPSTDWSEEEYEVDLKLRQDLRYKHPGLCAMEFEHIMLIIIEDLIGWDLKKKRANGRNGVFGKVLAVSEGCEEQGRKTLHSHLQIWIEGFNDIRRNLFHENLDVRMAAHATLINFLKHIMSSSYFEEAVNEQDITSNISCDCMPGAPISLSTVSLQNIRDMRHQNLCGEHRGVTSVCSHCAKSYSTTDILEKYICHLNEECSQSDEQWKSIEFPITRRTLDIVAMRYPYDIQRYSRSSKQSQILSALTNWKFNEHDYNHRPSCFKKGVECRFKLPKQSNCDGHMILHDEDTKLEFHDINGTVHNCNNFSIHTHRNICDLYMNTFSRAVSQLLGCNSNIQLGSYHHMFYTTLYSSKGNQEEENQPYINICNALAKRIKRLSDDGSMKDSTSYGVGLGHVLSGIAAHINSFVVSATMAWRLSVVGSRFRFSHDFTPLLLKQVEDWVDNTGEAQFRIRRKCVSNEDGEKEFISWLDSSLNNYIYRPSNAEFDNMSLWEFTSKYELRTKQIPFDSKSEITESDEADCHNYKEDYYFFDERHPGYKYAKLYQRKVPSIPILYMDGPFPDIMDLKLNESCHIPDYVSEARENYGKKAMILFYPFRSKLDIVKGHCWWDSFTEAKQSTHLLYNYQQILGNIQTLLDCQHNKTKLDIFDPLEKDTTLTHVDDDDDDDDDAKGKIEDKQGTANHLSCDAIEFIMDDQMSAVCENKISTNDVKPSYKDYIKPDLIINPAVNSGNIIYQEDTVSRNSSVQGDCHTNGSPTTYNNRMYGMIEVILKCIPLNNNIAENSLGNEVTGTTQSHTANGSGQINIESMHQYAKLNNLDKKQTIAFEVIVSTYILQCLKANINLTFGNNKLAMDTYKKLSARLLKLGAKWQLLMFMTGPGGGGKSFVIHAVLQYCKAFSIAAGVNFDSNTFLVTACSNSAAFLINGKTIHSMCHLNSKKNSLLRQIKRCNWRDVKFIIIDEVSFFSSKDLQKLDKHLRLLTGNRAKLYGGLHVIFVGDFFQLDPVSGQPIYGPDNYIHWKQAINACVFLDGSHRFKDDPKWGEIMTRLRMGESTKEDICTINSRVLGKNLAIPVESDDVCYACTTNKQRNIVSDSVFEKVVQGPSSNLEGSIIIKSKICDKKRQQFSKSFHNLVYRQCGDSRCTGTKVYGRVDPCLKLYKGCPIMFNLNDDGTGSNRYCKGMTGSFVGIVLKEGKSVNKEKWSNMEISAVFIDDVEYMLVQINDNAKSIIKIHPVEQTVSIDIPLVASSAIRTNLTSLKLTQFPIISNIATTGHKLQGMTKDRLIVIDFSYSFRNWIYVVLSRVRKLDGLYLKKPLDGDKLKGPSRELLTEMKRLQLLEEEMIKMPTKEIFDDYASDVICNSQGYGDQNWSIVGGIKDELLPVDMTVNEHKCVRKMDHTMQLKTAQISGRRKQKADGVKPTNKKRNVKSQKVSLKINKECHNNGDITELCDRNGDANTVVFINSDATITRASFFTLSPGVWLVDEVINFYMVLLNDVHWKNQSTNLTGRRPYAVKSYFLTLLSFGGTYNFERVSTWNFPTNNFESYKFIIFPLNISNIHWAVIVADLELRKIFYLDSLRGRNGLFWMQCIRQYFIDMYIQQHGVETVPQWTMECIYNCAQQPNSYDCGVFTCMFAYSLMMGQSIPSVYPQYSSGRFLIAQSIMNGCVLPLLSN